jgi:hypothetical protein
MDLQLFPPVKVFIKALREKKEKEKCVSLHVFSLCLLAERWPYMILKMLLQKLIEDKHFEVVIPRRTL